MGKSLDLPHGLARADLTRDFLGSVILEPLEKRD
jgi:hypothetical protein